jgi:predicted nucleic acid-binding protein
VIVVDAGCVYHLVTRSGHAREIAERLADEPDQAAPHVLDVEVFGVIRSHRMRGLLDESAARRAVELLTEWSGERYAHQPLLGRAWQLRANVRGWDAMYVALAELLGATLITTDGRLAGAEGPRCPIEVL